jgi:hypothetical protein
LLSIMTARHPMSSCLYIIENERLYRVGTETGWTPEGLTGHEWVNPPIAMTAVGETVYVIENQRLYQVRGETGWTPEGLTDQIWSKPPIAMASWDTTIESMLQRLFESTPEREFRSAVQYAGLAIPVEMSASIGTVVKLAVNACKSNTVCRKAVVGGLQWAAEHWAEVELREKLERERLRAEEEEKKLREMQGRVRERREFIERVNRDVDSYERRYDIGRRTC